jgi:hypothetical protein
MHIWNRSYLAMNQDLSLKIQWNFRIFQRIFVFVCVRVSRLQKQIFIDPFFLNRTILSYRDPPLLS